MEIFVVGENIEASILKLRRTCSKDGDVKRFSERSKGLYHSRSDRRKRKAALASNRRKRKEKRHERFHDV
jgi:ribosomal protein S21